jgi:hypothetical protein
MLAPKVKQDVSPHYDSRNWWNTSFIKYSFSFLKELLAERRLRSVRFHPLLP